MSDQDPSATQRTEARAALRHALDASHGAYHDLLDALGPADWRRRSAEPDWTIGGLLWRAADALFLLPRQIESLRAAPPGPAPARRFGWMTAQNTRLAAGRASPGDAAARYDRGREALITLLDGIPDEDWDEPLPGAAPEETIPRLIATTLRDVDAQLAAARRSLPRG
jgi:hypothetical protein